MGRLLKIGISQKTCQTIKFKAFGKKSKESVTDSCLLSSRQPNTKKPVKRAVLFLLVLTGIQLNAQFAVRDDTIHISEVKITGNRSGDYLTGRPGADSALISEYNGSSLGELISGNSPAYIKSYGPGSLASPSFRGTTAGHTAVAWNNISIESPMTGQSDLSLVPTGMADDIRIFYGSSSMREMRGYTGGLINLDTKPEWGEKMNFIFNPAAGSFGRRSLFVKARSGTSSFQSVTKAYILRAENDFQYLNSVSGDVPVTETRENSQVRQKGFSQELYFRKPGHEISARFWYQGSDRNLPVPIITPAPDKPERQYDESFRSMIEYDYQINKTKLNLTSAFISDRLDYTNEQASVDSKNSVNRMIMKGNLDLTAGSLLNISLSAGNEFDVVKTNNYDGRQARNVLSVDAAAGLNIMEWLTANLLLRETLMDDRFLAPDFFAGASIKPFRNFDYLLKAGFSRNSRIPTLNDLYWSPGGNSDLDNESGYSTEISLEARNTIAGLVSIGTDLTFFHNHIKGLIQWRPGEYSYWQADNIDDLVSEGLEATLNIAVRGNMYAIKMNSGYIRTISGIRGRENPENSGKRLQLIYVPADMFNMALRAERRNIYSAFRINHTGKRFTDTDNSRYLPPFTVADLDIGIKMALRKTLTDIRLGMENIFNIDYQNIAYYPMPRRNFNVSVIFQIKK